MSKQKNMMSRSYLVVFVLFALVATAFIRELPLRGRKSSQSQEEK